MRPFATLLVSLDSRIVNQSMANGPLRRSLHVLVVADGLNVKVVNLACRCVAESTWDEATAVGRVARTLD